MSVNQEFRFPSADASTSLYGRTWLPESGSPKAVVQIVHGICEHIGRYEPLAQFLTEHGFIVTGEDHLGHGNTPLSQEDVGFTADKGGWVLMTDNVHALRQRVGAEYPSLPYFLLGHSMGSFLARSYLIRYPGTVDGCILSGTAQQPTPLVLSGLAACALENKRLGNRRHSELLQSLCFGAYNKQFTPNRTPCDWICSVSEEVDRYMADPFCQIKASTTLMADMLSGVRFNQKKSHLLQMNRSTPIFFFAGALDPVGNNGKGVQAAYQSFLDAGCSDVSLKLYPNARHETHYEYCKEDVFRDILNWLDRYL